MPRRHVFRHVEFFGPTRPSARLLDRKLIELGYEGPRVLWGQSSLNKRQQLDVMRAAGVPCPRAGGPDSSYPYVLRTDYHRAGSGFWLARNIDEYYAAEQAGATHAMEYIANAREFRVHIIHGRSIKLTEKLKPWWPINPGPGEPETRWMTGAETQTYDDVIRSHAQGWQQMSPRPNAHKVSLRAHAKAAVAALNADFGAVDILLREGLQPAFFVLEVNRAPALTDPHTDTLDRYAQAFLRHAREQQLAGGN